MEDFEAYVIKGLLNAQHLEQLDFYLSQASFVDGQRTASGGAKQVKHNMQIDAQDQVVLPYIQQVIGQVLMQDTRFHQAFFPARVHPLIISRYGTGMSYGWHTDSPLMGNPPVRTDLAMTLFLSEPSTYEGGALTLKTDHGIKSYKLNKGDAVVYPCHYVHCVDEITAGFRLAAITWIQSSIRNREQRQILSQLKATHDALSAENPQHPQVVELIQIWSNLLRMWIEI